MRGEYNQLLTDLTLPPPLASRTTFSIPSEDCDIFRSLRSFSMRDKKFSQIRP